MSFQLPQTHSLKILTSDGRLLFVTRMLRMFAYGFLAVILALYLAQVGLTAKKIGLLLTLTLAGDTVVSLWITTAADRVGRRRMLVAGAGLMLFAGLLFVLTNDFTLLLIAATIGVISPSGYEVGPFLPIEQAALTQTVPITYRTRVFAWYNLAGSFTTALGALFGGVLAQAFMKVGMAPAGSYRIIILLYAAIGIILGIFFTRLSPAVEPPANNRPLGASALSSRLGLHSSLRIVLKLSSLFALDAFAGGFVIQSIVAYWFHIRFGIGPGLIGGIFFGANMLAGFSALAAVKVASRIGLVRTMVVTHIPSNILLILVPLMPNLKLAIAVLMLRFSISQMDVPTRQSYTLAVVNPDEASAAAGVTGIARTTGASLSPVLAGLLLGSPALLGAPFFLAGGLKIVYDILLYRGFRSIRPPEEKTAHKDSAS